MTALLQVANVSKHFGGFTALSDVSLAIAPGERFGLIGPIKRKYLRYGCSKVAPAAPK